MKLIAFYGPQGAGKSEAANALMRNHLFCKLSFADPIYSMVSMLLGVNARELDKNEPVLCGRSLRHLLQTLGTDWGRNMVGESIWLEALERRIDTLEDVCRFVVLDDLRFANEYNWLRQRGALIVRIYRKEGAPAQAGSGHASELDWKHFTPDFTITNPGTDLHEFRSFVREAITHCLRTS